MLNALTNTDNTNWFESKLGFLEVETWKIKVKGTTHLENGTAFFWEKGQKGPNRMKAMANLSLQPCQSEQPKDLAGPGMQMGSWHSAHLTAHCLADLWEKLYEK